MLGPELRVAGVDTGIPMPFDQLKVIPGMTLGHRPSHLAIFMLPLLMILAGFGMQGLLARGRIGRGVLGLLVAACVLEIFVWPLAPLPFHVDPIVDKLRGQQGAVMDVPNLQRNMPSMINQMAHGRPIVGGYLSRPPAAPAEPWRTDGWTT